MTKVGINALRWMAYSMPSPTTLDDLGLPATVTGWMGTNRARLLPHGASAWTNYAHIGSNWYEVGDPGTPTNPAISCGAGLEFIRAGFPNASDELVCPACYISRPNN